MAQGDVNRESREPTPGEIAAMEAEMALGRETSHRLGRLGSAQEPRDVYARRGATLRTPPFELKPSVSSDGTMRIDERNWAYGVIAVLMYLGIMGAIAGWAVWDARTAVKGAFLRFSDIVLMAGLFLPLCGYFVVDGILTGRIVTIDPRHRTVRIRGRGLRRDRWSDEVYPIAECQWRVYRADVSISRGRASTIKFDGWMIVLAAPDQGVVVAMLKEKEDAQEALRRLVQAAALPVVDTRCEVSWWMRT